MPADKFSATWVSHSSIRRFLECPRAYYLENVYRDPKTGHKIQIVSPAMSLGIAVHDVLEALSTIPTEERFASPLMAKFDKTWEKVSGKIGGFTSRETEDKFKQRGEAMIKRVEAHPGILLNKAVKIKEDLPWYWLSEEDNIILCGKVDWLEYLPESEGVNLVDFKTSLHQESQESLQLPIYYLLVKNCQKWTVEKASYWYLEMNDDLTPLELPDPEESEKKILKIARDIKLARTLNRFVCPHGDEGCRMCQSLEKVIQGKAEKVGVSEFQRDLYLIPDVAESEDEDDSYIL